MLRPVGAIGPRRVTSIVAPLALLLSVGISQQAMAACNGAVPPGVVNSAAISILCNGTGTSGNVTVSAGDHSTYVDTTTTALSGSANNNNVLLQFDGHGRILDNSGWIINNHVYTGGTGNRNRTAVVMGQSTVNAGAATTFGSISTSGGNTSLVLGPTFANAAAADTAIAAYKGQSMVFGTFDGDDFAPGQAVEIDSVTKAETSPGSGVYKLTVKLVSAVPASIDGTGIQRYSIVSNFGTQVLVDGKYYNDAVINRSVGKISTSIAKSEIVGNQNPSGTQTPGSVTSPSYTASLIAVDTRVAGSYLIDNKQGGEISATHAGIGLVQAIFEGGQVLDMLIKNDGLIAITREAPLTLFSVSATANPTALSSDFPTYAAQTVANAWTIATEEEAEGFTIANGANGVIRSQGDYTGTVYSRVEEGKITNYGTIEHLSGATVGKSDADIAAMTNAQKYNKGFAIGAVSNGGGLRTLELDNYGTINGDILGVNGQAVRWYMLSTEGTVSTTGTYAGGYTQNANLAEGMDQRLFINSQTGEQSSAIFNAATGEINGNMWFSNGEHAVENEGTITGNIDVDQRATMVLSNFAASCSVTGACTGAATGTATTSMGTTVVMSGDDGDDEEDDDDAVPPRVVTTTYTGSIVTPYASGNATATETVAITPGAREFSLNNSGDIYGNITVNQAQLSTYTLPTPATASVCSSGTSGCTTGAGSPTVSTQTITFADGTTMTTTVTTTVYTNGTRWVYSNPQITSSALAALDREFSFENSGTLHGNMTVATGTAALNPNSTVIIKEHVFGNGSLDKNNPNGNSGYIDGTLRVSDTGGISSLARTTTIMPVIDSLVKSGEWYRVAKTLDDSGNIGDLPDVEDSALVDWTAEKNSHNALVIGSTVADASIVEGLSAPGIATINGLMKGGNATTNALGGAVQMLSDEGDVRKAGEQLKPETNFATQQAAFTLNMMTGNYIDSRLNGVGATGASSSGFAAASGLGMSQVASAAPEGRMSLGLGGNDGRMNIGANDGRMDAGIYEDHADPRKRGYTSAMWGQAFGAGLDQGERSNVDGYQTHIYGGIAGADNWISSTTRLGFAAGYGNTSIDGSGDTRRNQTDIDSYLGVIYGAYKGSGWYLSSRAGYAWHDYSTSRVIDVPVNDTATGSHTGNQYSAAAEVGAPLYVLGGTLTPIASLTWSQLDQDGYTEGSQNGTGLSIASQENTSLASGLGAKAQIPIDVGTLLEGRAVWYHEFEDTNQQVTAAFGGGESFLASGPSVGRDTASIGAGLFAYASEGVSFQLNYDALLRQDFVGHTGSARVKAEF